MAKGKGKETDSVDKIGRKERTMYNNMKKLDVFSLRGRSGHLRASHGDLLGASHLCHLAIFPSFCCEGCSGVYFALNNKE